MSTQDFIHSLEQGRLARWVGLFVAIVLISFRACFFILYHFAGLSDAKGMDQAQIAREIASGHGYTTKSMTPLGYAMFKKKGPFPLDRTPDIYEAPLNPLVNSVFLLMCKKSWIMDPKNHMYVADQIISMVAVIFMALGIGVSYLTARRVFDSRIAGLSMGLVLICNQIWRFCTTGLPQMLMFFIFSCCLYLMFRAIEARRQEKPVLGWLTGAAVLFGLLALAHPLTIWIFVGALVFSLFYFVPRGQAAGIMLAVFLAIYSGWLVRNYKVCGNPLGLGVLSLIGTMDGSESDRMRGQDISYTGLGLGALRSQMRAEFITQTGNIYGLLGQNPVAPIFFLTLLYTFKRKEAADMLWGTFLMFAFGFVGMTISGSDNANNLYPLFTPIMTLYGFAYVMMLWARLEFNIPILRYLFVTCIYLVSCVPLAADIMNPPFRDYQWPPYAPQGIAQITGWTNENDVIASDMPWAVAWYGNRKSLLLPTTMDDFMNFCDWTEFSDSMAGLYITPLTGDKKFISDILYGPDRDWAPLIYHGLPKTEFPFRHVRSMPIDNQCVFYGKVDRWSPKTD